MSELAKALAAFQANLPRVTKDTQGQRSRYADLATLSATIVPLLAEKGLAWTACPTMMLLGDTPTFVLEYRLSLAGSNEHIGGMYPLGTGNPQQLGSAITYARRYCLCAVTGVAPDDEDDDGQAASEYVALRQAPPETRADGSATFAEIERMQTGPVPGTTRQHERDAEPFDTSATTAGEVRTNRMRQMFAIYKELGVTDKDDMLADLSAILGRPIGSRADLTLSDLTTVNVILRRRQHQREPEGADA